MSRQRDQAAARCTASCRNGRPCTAWAEWGSDPPRCRSHRGWALSKAQLPAAHRASDVDAMIAGLQRRLTQLSQYIDQYLPDLDHSTYARLTALHGQLASRVSRLLLDRKQLVGDDDNELIQAVHAALDSLSTEWGIEL